MAELSKEAKLMMLIDAIVGFIYAFLMVIIPDIYFGMSEFDPYCPDSVRQVGTIFLVLALFFLVALKRNDFDEIKIAWEIGIGWIVAINIHNIINSFVNVGSAVAQASGWFNNILGIVFIILNIYLYQRELKNQ